jgi:hypothetical protein
MIFFTFLSMRSSRSHVQSYGFNELPGLTSVFFSLPFFRLNLFFLSFAFKYYVVLDLTFIVLFNLFSMKLSRSYD